MEFRHNYDITHLTTFGLPAKAAIYAEYTSERELAWLARQPEFRDNEVLHLGGGSNLLFVHDFNGLVLHSRIMERTVYRKSDDEVFVIGGAGENWNAFVRWTIGNGLAGLENLAGIPGSVGAAPVQNVGAYGVEAGDLIHAVYVYDTAEHRSIRLTPAQCAFGYRDSMFKHAGPGRYVVMRVAFRLKVSDRAGNLSYGPLGALAATLGHHPTPAEVADEVVRLRDSKLPDPAVTGSAGSFFRNPVVHRYFYEQEMTRAGQLDIPSYPVPDNPDMVKVPAGWLIEHSGLKGYAVGGAQVWPRQCLVLANTGGATADDVVALADHVTRTVRARFGVELRPEVNYVDTAMQVTVLGSGTSKGVPEIGCPCEVCTSSDPRDSRLRASVLIRTHGLTLLIDPSPDFRQQALRAGISRIDAVLVTHTHFDHVGGFDDLRPFCAGGPLPVWLAPDVNADLHRRLDYCFREHLYPGVPSFAMHEIDGTPFRIGPLDIVPVRVMHGRLPIYGFRIGRFAYITDCKTIPEDEIWKLEDLDVLVINALRDTPHFAHLNVEEALEIIRRVKPRRTWLTHFSHHIGLQARREPGLPNGVHMAYDTLRIDIP